MYVRFADIYEGDELPEGSVCPLCKSMVLTILSQLNNKINMKEIKKMKYVCDVCGWEYDESVGDPDNGIAPGTKFEDLPEDFVCPMCGVGKDTFSKVEE